MQFQPSFCPCGSPQCQGNPGFQYQLRGTFKRACDGRVVQRYQCKRCKRMFSAQTFRVDRRLRKPALDGRIFGELVSKVTQRQIARRLHCTRRTVARRLDRFGEHCRDFHQRLMYERGQSRAWEGRFLLDERPTSTTGA